MAELALASPELGTAQTQFVLNFVVENICFLQQTWPQPPQPTYCSLLIIFLFDKSSLDCKNIGTEENYLFISARMSTIFLNIFM
jgi:hypothetical protein